MTENFPGHSPSMVLSRTLIGTLPFCCILHMVQILIVGRRCTLGTNYRKGNNEGRPFTVLTFDMYVTAVILDTVAQRKSPAGSLSGGLRGEKEVEELTSDLHRPNANFFLALKLEKVIDDRSAALRLFLYDLKVFVVHILLVHLRERQLSVVKNPRQRVFHLVGHAAPN
jgi:hypothetical protein